MIFFAPKNATNKNFTGRVSDYFPLIVIVNILGDLNCVVFDKSRKDNFEISSHFFILIRYFSAQIIFRFIRLEWFFIRSIRNSFNANKSIAFFFFFRLIYRLLLS